MSKPSERIIQSARNGDQEALRELYDTTKNYAWFIAKRYLQNDSDVEDILQEVYFNAFSKLNTYEEGAPFKPWLHKIISNKCIDFMRKNKHIFISQDEVSELSAENEDAIPSEWLERAEKRRDIIKIIDALPHGQRMAVTLFYLESFPISKIAQAMGVTLGTVKYNLHHGRNRIKEAVILEAKRGNKLYSLVPIPPLITLYAFEAEVTEMSELASEAIWASTVGSLTTAGILSSASSLGTVAKATGLGAKFAALSTGMKAVTVTATIAVAGVAIAIPIYTIPTNTQSAYSEDYQLGANEQEESGGDAIESNSIVLRGTDSKVSEEQELALAQSSTDDPEKPILNAASQKSAATERPSAEPSTTEDSASKPLNAELPVTELPISEPPVPDPSDTEPLIPELPVTEPLISEPPATEQPDTITHASEPSDTEPPIIEPPDSKPLTPEPSAIEPPATSGSKYIITDYYDEDGGFSALGLALEEKNTEKQMTVTVGDLLIIGDQQYIVAANSLTLSFYTQPSLNNAIKWWTDYLNSWEESGKVIKV